MERDIPDSLSTPRPAETPQEPEPLPPLSRFRSPLTALLGGILLLVSCVSLWATSESWRYYLRSSSPQDLGTAKEALAGSRLRHNTYVRLRGRPLLRSEGGAKTAVPNPGCLTGPTRRIYYTLLSETGDRVVVRTLRSMKKDQLPTISSFTGRLLRVDTTRPPYRLYRRFIYRLTDCKHNPKTCDKFLLASADIATETLVAALGRGRTLLRGINGESIQVRPMTPLYLAFRFPGDYEYTVHDKGKREAVDQVKALGVPYVWVGRSGHDQEFIIRARKPVADRLIRSQRRGSGYNISSRTAGYHVRFGWLRRQGEHIVLLKHTKGFPVRYRVRSGRDRGAERRLEPIGSRGRPRVRIDHIIKATYHGPRLLPRRLWLLEEGVEPRHARAGGLVGLGLLLLAMGGVVLMGLGLRRPRA